MRNYRYICLVVALSMAYAPFSFGFSGYSSRLAADVGIKFKLSLTDQSSFLYQSSENNRTDFLLVQKEDYFEISEPKKKKLQFESDYILLTEEETANSQFFTQNIVIQNDTEEEGTESEERKTTAATTPEGEPATQDQLQMIIDRIPWWAWIVGGALIVTALTGGSDDSGGSDDTETGTVGYSW